MTNKNWLGMQSHVIDLYAFWKCSPAELEKARATYQRLRDAGATENDLVNLMDFVARNTRDDEAFNAAGESM